MTENNYVDIRNGANDNLPRRLRASHIKRYDTAIAENTLIEAELAVKRVWVQLGNLSTLELGLMWNKATTNFNMAAEMDHVSDALLLLIEAELDSRETGGGAA